MPKSRSGTIGGGECSDVPTKIEKDEFSGRDTTGHEWDGVKELNTPLPKWWYYVFLATIVWSVGYFLLYPSIPGISGHFGGLLGYSTRVEVERQVKAVAAQRAVYMDRIAALPFEDIRKDGQLNAVALAAGRVAFADNCQPCHGPGGQGRPGYPALGDDVWLWGGSYADIQKSIAHGIRAEHAETRSNTMPGFGAALQPAEIDAVTDYVMSLYGTPVPGRDLAPGQKIFAEQCAECHGAQGQGNRERGGPPLASRVHLFGDDRASVRAQIVAPRMGVMPAWTGRLDAGTIKALTLYVHQLGGGE